MERQTLRKLFQAAVWMGLTMLLFSEIPWPTVLIFSALLGVFVSSATGCHGGLRCLGLEIEVGDVQIVSEPKSPTGESPTLEELRLLNSPRA